MKGDDGLHILLADDEAIVRETLGDYLHDAGHDVETAENGTVALSRLKETDYDVALLDIRMPGVDGLTLLTSARKLRPDTSVIIITGHGSMEVVIDALRRGAADFLKKPVKLHELDAALTKAARLRALNQDKRRLKATIGGLQTATPGLRLKGGLIGESAAMRAVREDIEKVVAARCDTVLITGETGSGKEVVAREIHFSAEPDDSPFIPVNCPAIPESLVESELFGHMRGSFTGASADRAGYFELADGGTLFLDEIGDLSAMAQAKLLRSLETRCVRRVGGAKEISVDVRVIAATNAPLEELVEDGRFRADLYYRLNLFGIHVAPLREHRGDVMPLAQAFMDAYAAPRGLVYEGFSDEARGRLEDYDYPGNVRELKNLVERAAILAGGGRIEAEHVVLGRAPARRAPSAPDDDGDAPASERQRITDALEATNWNRREAAKLIGMPYSTLRYKIKRMGID